MTRAELVAEPIEARQLANQALRQSPQFAADMANAGVTDAQIALMQAGRLPLGFEHEAQFAQFKAEMDVAFVNAGLSDAQVGLKGTSTTFYSENPGKPLGHYWDRDLFHPGDYDLNVTSRTMVDAFESSGVSPSEKYGVFKTADMQEAFPALNEFRARWANILGRDVNFVGYPAQQPRDITEYILRGPQ